KAQIQEKVFAIAALKNDLRKLKGNSVYTKFSKTSVLGKPVLRPLRNQSVVRQPNAFTQHYLPKKLESAFAKPDHMIASNSSRNSSKNMPRFSSNDMVHNYYLDKAKKKTQERDRNSKPSVMTPFRFQSATADSKPKPRSTNHSFRSLPMSKRSYVTMPAMPKADHSKSPRKLFHSCTNKVESEPPHGSNVDISKIHVYKQTLDLSAGTSINVPKEQSLDVSTRILWNVNKDNLRTMASNQNSSDPAPKCQTMASNQNSSDPAPKCQTTALNHDSLSLAIQRQEKVTQADRTVTTSNELDLLFSPMFDELLNGSSKVVSKSSAVSAVDAPNQRQQLTTPSNNHTTPAPTCQVLTLAPTVISSEKINQAETYAENDQVADDEFINIFSNPVQDQEETSTRHVNSSNMHTFYQRCSLSLLQRKGRKRKVLVSRQTTWYEMFDSSRTGCSGN
nr:hypothetical protein [Tanacetum cinerariifolium]